MQPVKEYSRQILNHFFGFRCDPKVSKKFNQKLIKKEIECAFISGVLQVTEEVILKHANEPFESADLVIGELHNQFKDYYNFQNTQYLGGTSLGKIEIENLIYAKNQINLPTK